MHPGLCANCSHAKSLSTKSGNPILMCELALSDDNFARYPRLPVTDCAGYKP